MEAMQRQIEADPAALQRSAKPSTTELPTAVPEEDKKEERKRPAIDKQAAFLEFKQSPTGRDLENEVQRSRDEVRTRKQEVATLTTAINTAKKEMDRV